MIVSSNKSNIQRIHIYKNKNQVIIHVTYLENFRFFLYELTFSLYCSNKILTPISSHKTNLWHLLSSSSFASGVVPTLLEISC